MEMIRISENVTEIEKYAFLDCQRLTVICRENSYAHRYCAENFISFLFDYQYEAFRGLNPHENGMFYPSIPTDEEKTTMLPGFEYETTEEGIIETGSAVPKIPV